jgi:hypothetical protein
MTLPSSRVARILCTCGGRIRVWRTSSVRWYISLHGRPVALLTCTATCTGSQNSRRPKEPPAGSTWATTWSWRSPRSAATDCSAMIGVCIAAQISQRPGRTSAIAVSTSSGQWAAARHSNSPSIVSAPSGGSASGGLAAFSVAITLASDWPASGPSPQLMSSALSASQAWPKVSAITATPGGRGTIAPPGGMITMSITPGIARTLAALLTDTTWPRICEGMRSIVGLAPGTSRSMPKVLRPVTMSRASMRGAGWPITR